MYITLFLFFVLVIEIMGGYTILKAIWVQNHRANKTIFNLQFIIAAIIIIIVLLVTLFIQIYLV